MRSFEILTEGRSQSITEAQFNKLLSTKYSDCVDKTPIFRGIVHTDESYLLAKPSNKLRIAANTSNYVNLCVSNFASWKPYPNRSKSFICATSYDTASNYGEVYQVYPMNGTRIGVCEVDDFWISFDTLSDVGLDVETLNYYFLSKITSNATNFKNFVQRADKFGESIREENVFSGSVGDLLQPFIEGAMPLSVFIEQILDPTANGFKLQTTGSFNCGSDQEVWAEGPILMKRVE